MARRFVCGTPDAYCSGNITVMTGVKSKSKSHSSSRDAFKCYANYLIKVKGYKRIGSREFINPETGAVLVISKESKHGTPLRSGKGGEGQRWVKKHRTYLIEGGA